MTLIWDALDSLMAWLCQVIYPLIAYAYKLFYNIGTLRIIKDENLTPIYNRITLILGLVMLFVITFQLIQYVMEPDNFNDKEKGLGKVMYRMIISVILIAFVPNIFDFAFELQSDIMDNNIIQSIILGTKNEYNENWGGQFSASILHEFYRLNPNVSDYECTDSNGMNAESIINLNLNSLATKGNLDTLSYCITDKSRENEAENVIKFDGIIAVLSGALILWMLIIYCLDLGTRVVQLTYLQIIAPIPIIMYMLPKKDGAFEKWVKQCLTTFLDLFLRTAIICFAVLIISTITNSLTDINDNITASGQGDVMFTSLLKVCLVLGVMTFAKKAGDMLKELFPKGNAASGELGISPKRIPEPAKRVAGAGVGLVAGGTVGMVRRMYGAGKGALRRDKDVRERLTRSYNDAKANYTSAKETYNQLMRSGTANATDINNARNNMESYRKAMNDYKSQLGTERLKTGARVATGLGGGFVAGTLSGANKGMVAGLTTKGGFGGVSKATQSIIKENKAIEEWRENGGTSSVNRVISGLSQRAGLNPTEVYDRRKEKIEKENTVLKNYSESISKAKDAIEKEIDKGKCDEKSINAKNYRIKQFEHDRLVAQAGNLKLTDFKYRDAAEKENAKEKIKNTLEKTERKLTNEQIEALNLDLSSSIEYRKNNKLLEIAEKMWDNDKENNKNNTKFSTLKGQERENAISKMLDNLADSVYEKVDYEATVQEFEARSDKARQEASDLKKKAVADIGDAVMNGGYENPEIALYIATAKQAANLGSADTDFFINSDLTTFAKLDDLSKAANNLQGENKNDLDKMQQSPEYKAAQADKKYNENGKK